MGGSFWCCGASLACLVRLILVVKHPAYEDLLVHYRFERLDKVVGLCCISNEPLGIAHLGKEVSGVLLTVISQSLCECTDWLSVIKWNSILYLWVQGGIETKLWYNILMQLKESPDHIGDRFVWWTWFFEVYDWICGHHERHGGYTWGEHNGDVEVGITRWHRGSDLCWVGVGA